MIDFEKLAQLKRLRDDGLLDKEEFMREKAAVLAGERAAAPVSYVRRVPAPLWVAAVLLVAFGLYLWVNPRSSTTQSTVAPIFSTTEKPRPAAAATVDDVPTIGPGADASAAKGSSARVGRCHTGECTWSRELKRETVGAGPSGELLRLSLLGGSSDDHGSPVSWDKAPHDVYVFCSASLPSVMLKTNDGWQVDVLDFARGIPGILESSERLWRDTCGVEGDPTAEVDGVPGYVAIPENRREITISKPQDIFDRADF